MKAQNKENIRALALESLLLIGKTGKKMGDVTDAVLEKYCGLPKADRAFYLRLVRGTVENRIRADLIISTYSSVPPRKMKPAILEILRMAVYQIEKMDSVPDRAAVNEAVRLTEKKGFRNLKGFVNGVLRSYLREPEKFREPSAGDPEAYIQAKYSMPLFLAEKWLTRYGLETTEKICASFADTPGLTARIRGDREKVLESLRKEGAAWKEAPYVKDAIRLYGFESLADLDVIRDGSLVVQDVSSQLSVYAAGIQEGMEILDVCAAPGGKSILASDLTGPEGCVTARDLSEARIRRMEENIRRCGISNIKTEIHDAAVPDESLYGRMDVVLVDAPCSGYGVIGRKCDVVFQASEEKEKSLAMLQRQILQTSAQYVKEGGVLIYSTCTINREENEANRERFLEDAAEAGFAADDLTPFLPTELRSGTAREGHLQLLPGIHDCDGFFIARFVRGNGKKR